MSFSLRKLKYIVDNYFIEAIILIIVGLILLNTLFIYPVVGKCDNGDFARLFSYGGLKDLANNYKDMYDRTVHINYGIANYGFLVPFGANWVSGTVLLKAAELICFLAQDFRNGSFDIRYLALVYCILFLIGIFLILSNKRFSKALKLISGIYIILFFTDASYLVYFNSFFGEAGTIVFFFLNLGTYLLLINHEKPKRKHFIYFFIASAGFLTSKAQELPLLLFMLIIYGGLYLYYRDKKIRKCIIIGSSAVVLLCASTYFSMDKFTNYNNIYQSVFFGVLPGSKTPKSDLEELGVNSKFVVFKEKSFYDRSGINDPQGEEMQKEFYSKVSTGKVLAFYIKHPDRLWSKITDSANHSYGISVLSKANFVKGQFTTEKPVNNFRLNLVNKFPEAHHSIIIYMSFSILYLAVIITYFVKYRDRSIRLLTLMLLFILAAGSSQLVLPVIGSGESDFIKHLFLVSLAYDTMFGIAILWCLHVFKGIFYKEKGVTN